MSRPQFSSEIRSFLLADFSSEVNFGVRNVPTSLSLAVGPQALQVFLYVPDSFNLNNISIRETTFQGFVDEENDTTGLGAPLKPSAPIKMKRNFSLDEGITATQPIKLMRSLSSTVDSSSLSPNNDSPLLHRTIPMSRPGEVKSMQLLRNTRCLYLLVDYSPAGGFVPSSVDISVVIGEEKTTLRANLNFSQALIAVGTMFYQHQKQDKLLPAKTYTGLLEGLKVMMEVGVPHRPSVDACHWFHGAFLAFLRKWVAGFDEAGFELFVALTCLAELFEGRRLPSWLVLVAVGHCVGTLTSNTKPNTRTRWLELKRIRSLWRVPQHILRTRFDSIRDNNNAKASNASSSNTTRPRKADSAEFQSLNCLAVRTALFFLCNEDSSANSFFPVYSPFSGCVPLINLLGMQSKGLFSVQYFGVNGSGKSGKEWSDSFLSSLSGLFGTFDGHVDALVANSRSLSAAERDRIIDTLYSKIELLTHTNLIWKAAAQCVFQGLSSDTALEMLKREIIPQTVEVNQRLLAFLMREFESATTTWEVINADDGVSSSGFPMVVQRALTDMEDNLKRCQEHLNSVGNLLNAHQSAVAEFNTCLNSVRAYNSFLSLRDIERLIGPTARSVSISRIQKSTALMSYYGVGNNNTRPIDSLKALIPVGNSVMMLAENYVAMLEGTWGTQRTVVAGSYSQGNAAATRLQSKFKNPESICTFSYLNGERTEHAVAISDSGNHCIRICQIRSETSAKFVDDKMITFGDRKVPDFVDGNSADALFSTPAGLVGCNNGLLICDSGNHVIRYLRFANGEWLVSTVAGSPKSPGTLDGKALGEARCTFPGHITASLTRPNVFYFIEESGNPAIREFNAIDGTVTTLLRGSPLIAPGSVCAADDNSLLLCDGGACCIWSFDLATRKLTPKVTAENIYLLNVELYDDQSLTGAAASRNSGGASSVPGVDKAVKIIPSLFIGSGTASMNSRFSPVSITRVRPGWYVFGESNTRHCLFRYLEQQTLNEEVDRLKSATDLFKVRKPHLKSTTEQLQGAIADGLSAIRVGLGLPAAVRTHGLEKNFTMELKELDQLNRQFGDSNMAQICLNLQLYINMLLNAPSLSSAMQLISSVYQRLNLNASKDAAAGGMGMGMGGGLMGLLRGNMELGMGGRLDDETAMRRQMDLETMQQGVVQFFTSCDFSSPNFNSVSDLLFIFSSMNSHTRRACLRAVLQNDSFQLPVSVCMVDIVSKCIKMETDEKPVSRGEGKQLRDSLLLWLGRITNFATPTNVASKPFLSICSEILTFWKAVRDDYVPTLTEEDNQEVPDDGEEEMEGPRGIAGHVRSIINMRTSMHSRRERLAKSWHWMASSHLEVVCNEMSLAGQEFVKEANHRFFFKDIMSDNKEKFLRILPALCTSFNDMQSVIQTVGVGVCVRYTPSKSLAVLLSNYPANTSKYVSVFVRLLEGMWEYSVSEFRRRAPNKTQLDSWDISLLLLEVYPAFWPKFVEWGRSPKYESSNRVPVDSQARVRLQKSVDEVVEYLKCISEHVIRGHYTIRELNSVIDSFNDLRPAWELIGSPLADSNSPSFILTLRDSMLSCWNECNTLMRIMTVFMPDCDELQYVTNFANNWETHLVATVRSVLLLEQPNKWNVPTRVFAEHFSADYLMDRLACRPISEVLVAGVDWFVKAEACDLFKAFWHNNKGNSVPSVSAIIPKWSRFLIDIINKSIRFGQLDDYGEILLSPREVSQFVLTAGGVSVSSDGSIKFGLLKGQSRLSYNSEVFSAEELESLSNKCVAQWKHIRDFYFGSEHVFRVLVAAREHLNEAEHHHLNSAEVALQNLCTDVSKHGPWKEQTYANAAAYWNHSKTLDVRLLGISFQLLLCIQEHVELINWLRSISDDENFTSSLDIARSLQEMNAPIELWDSKVGRINEKFLSMISNVRDYLYAYLYTTDHRVPTFEMFAAIFSAMDMKTSFLIMENIRTCDEVRTALAKVIGVKTNLSGSSRLVKLYSEESSSIWRCQRSAAAGSGNVAVAGGGGLGSDSSVALRYTIDDNQGNKIWRQHVANDLIEFQSNLVLERPTNVHSNSSSADAEAIAQSDRENELIETFLIQCGLMRRLSAAFLSLYSSGHFNFYPDYQFDISVSAPQSVFQNKVSQLESFQEEWNYHVQSVRTKYYFINYLDLKRCFHLKCLLNDIASCQALSDASSVEKKETFPEKLGKYLCFVNPAAAVDSFIVNDFARTLIDKWIKFVPVAELDGNEMDVEGRDSVAPSDSMPVVDDALTAHNEAKNELTKLAVILEELLPSIGRRVRKIHIKDIDKSVVNERIPRGIHIAQGFTLKGVYDQLLTLYAIQGEIGEWENVLCCTKHTTLEEVSLLIRRWHRAHAYNREGVLYALVDVNKLNYEVQHATVQLFRELGPSQSALNGPIVLITESYDNCHLTSQFLNNKITAGILPPPLLRQIGEFVQKEGRNGNGLQLFTSTIPGTGKSFNVRSLASNSRLLYSHVPINNQITPTNVLIHRIEENMMRSLHSIHSTPLALSQHTHSLMNADVVLHFDIASTAGSTLISTIFGLVVFGVLADTESEATFFYDPLKTVVAIELAAGLHEGLFSQMVMYPQIHCTVTSDSFEINERELRRGMGDEFRAVLYSTLSSNVGSVGEEGLETTTAYDRLTYILNCLKLIADNNGSFPVLVNNVGVEDRFNGSKKYAFELLMHACELDQSPSLWCIWAFVNVLYWQLQQIQHPASPVNIACIPDIGIKLMTLDYDTKMKARVKGEMVAFLCKTAREFATKRNTKKSCDPNRIIGVLVRNYSGAAESVGQNPDINKLFWKREEYDNDGRPVFKSPLLKLGAHSRYLFLHYRESENRYVIDDTVNYTGRVIAYSSTDGALEEVRFEKRSVTNFLKVNVHLKFHNKDGPKERIEINGFQNCQIGPGSMLSSEENGVYYRLPPSENIEDQPHYFKNDQHPRHLYFVKVSETGQKVDRWVIGITCNVLVMGTQAFASPGAKLLDNDKFMFYYFGPNTIEEKMKIECITAQQAPTRLAELAQLHAITAGLTLREDAVDLVSAQLESANLGVDVARWGDSNHECMVFNNSTGNVSFLSQNPELLIKNMHPVLLKHLQTNHISIGEDLKVLSDKHWEILSALTGVSRTREEARTLIDESFCLTGDSLLKILAIVSRCRCKVPVVLLGECGCGKTMLLSFLCRWLGVTLLSLDVHGGTTENEIIGIFDRATSMLTNADMRGSSFTVFVFLDEVNTCAHMGLLNEAICHRSIYGRRLHDGIQILAALNPYRMRAKKEEMGLTFNLGTNPLEDPMSKLVYRVHPIPPTLKDYIFDFGSLEPATEALYIHSMVVHSSEIADILANYPSTIVPVIAAMIGKSQDFVRFYEGDPSVVSLRDVKRVLVLLRWFFKELPEQSSTQVTPLARAVTLALAHVYCYRISSTLMREEFWDSVSAEIRDHFAKHSVVKEFQPLSVDKTPQVVVSHAQKMFVDNLEIEDGISMNEALSENLFVAIVCILNKIPIFIVGKPGTSKTLAIQVIASNLRGDKSAKSFWHDKPSVHIFQYQCSPLSTSNSIKYQFESAKAFQEHSSNVLTVLLLDEVGLAENSPDMPLKVLHYMLVNPPIAIVGLSNWTLDSSKMNRAICLQRPEPSEMDIMVTGRSIVATDDTVKAADSSSSSSSSTAPSAPGTFRRQTSHSSSAKPWLGPLAKAFHEIYTQQKSELGLARDFIGMRDYYGLLKFLRVNTYDRDLTPDLLARAVARNLGGRPDCFDIILAKFVSACFPKRTSKDVIPTPEVPRVRDLVDDNLRNMYQKATSGIVSTDCRHLMILSQNEAVLQLLFGCQVIDEANTSVLIGSKFRDDLDELHLIQQINKVKRAMQEGKVAVLVHNENIYESLYDLLNQRYVKQRDPVTKEEIRLLRLAMGSKSQLCPVHDNFKLIVVVQQSHAYESLDLPLLNRFEKQVLSPKDLLSTAYVNQLLEELDSWCQNLVAEVSLPSISSIFCGFNEDTLSSLILNLTNFCRDDNISNKDNLLLQAKLLLLKMASPLAILHSKSLKSLIQMTSSVDAYFASRSHLFALIDYELRHHLDGTNGDLFILATRAPVHHFEASMLNWIQKHPFNTMSTTAPSCVSFLKESDVVVVQLAHVASERTLQHVVEKFYADTSKEAPRMLSILADPLYCPPAVVSHAKQIVLQAYRAYRPANGVQRIALFVIHMPHGVSSRLRDFKLDLYPPWSYLFLDELVDPVDAGLPDLMKLLSIPLHELCANSTMVDVPRIMTASFQSAMRFCSIPAMQDDMSSSRGDVSYVKMLKELLGLSPFMNFVHEAVLKCVHQTESGWKSSAHGNMELHVYRACENLRGSLRQSLQLTVEGIIVQAFAHVLRQLDVNYNLTLLYVRMNQQNSVLQRSIMVSDVKSTTVAFLDVWLGMAQCLLSPDDIALTCNADLSQPPPTTAVANSGLGGAYACRFPFSEKLIHQLQQTIRKAPETLGIALIEKCHSLTALVNTAFSGKDSSYASVCIPAILGESAVQSLSNNSSSSSAAHDPHEGQNFNAYLYDFVASCIYPMPGVTLADEMAIVTAFFNSAASAIGIDVNNIYLPGYVHAFYWQLENRIYHFMSTVSRLRCAQTLYNCPSLLSPTFKDDVNTCLQSVYSVTNLKLLDVSILRLVLHNLRSSLHAVISNDDADFNNNIFKWSLLFGSLLTDIEALVTIMLNSNDGHTVSNAADLENDVLGAVWFLKAVHAVCSAYGANAEMASRGRELLASLIVKIESIRLDPTSHDTFATFARICHAEAAGVFSSLLIHCYLSKFALPEFELLKRVGRPHLVSLQFLSVLGSLATQLIGSDSFVGIASASASSSSSSSASNAPKDCNREYSMILCRAIVDVIYKAYTQEVYRQEICQVFNGIIAQHDQVGLKFLQMFLERMSVDLSAASIFSDDLSLCDELLTVDSFATLQQRFGLIADSSLSENRTLVAHVAKAKLLLKDYAFRILAELKGGISAKGAVLPQLPPNLQRLTSSSLHAQIYTLTNVLRAGGKNALVLYLQQRNPPVLPFGVKAIDPNAAKIKMLDPFSMLVDYKAYNSACTAVIQVQMRSSVEPIDTWSKNFVKDYKQSSWTDKMCLLIAAIHTQISGSRLPIAHEVVENIIEWVRSDYNSRKTAGTSTATISLTLYLDLMRSCLRCQNNHAFRGISDSRQCLLENLRMHATFLASSSASGWLNTLISDPVSLKSCYLPAMMDDESVAMMQFTDERGNVLELGWYECPNGHRYAVGECTLPMQEARCPECKAPIGGRNHTAVGGVKRLGKTSETLSSASKQGYLMAVTVGPKAYEIFRLGKLTTVVLRLIQHLIMLTSSKVYPDQTPDMRDNKAGARSAVAGLMFTESKTMPEIQRVWDGLEERIRNDFDALLAVLQYNEEDIAMGLHMMLNKLYFSGETKYATDESMYGKALTDEQIARQLDEEYRGVPQKKKVKELVVPPANMSTARRIQFEQSFEKEYVNDTFTKQNAVRVIQAEKLKFEDVNIDSTLKACLNDHYLQVMEIAPHSNTVQAALGSLWRFHDNISFEGFAQQFRMNSDNAKLYPILSAVLENEAMLPKIKHIVDILAWQAVVFKVYKSGSISRDEASNLTNRSIIERLPPDEQPEARVLLRNYCDAFNDAILLPGFLLGCADNIFKSKDHKYPDIMAGQAPSPVPMNEDASIAFALPSTVMSGDGLFKDPRSLCTIFIVNTLKVSQDRIVQAFMDIMKDTKQGQADEGSDAMAVEGVVSDANEAARASRIVWGRRERADDEYHVPVTTYQTPSALVRRRLLAYDRNTHLMPLVYNYSKQDLSFGKGELLGYDFGRIESDLCYALMPTINPVAFAIEEFLFQGELQDRGGMKAVAEKIKQEDLPSTILDQIMAEVDTDHRYVRLTKQLEDCVAFLTFFLSSTSRMNGDTKLCTFIVEAMLVAPEAWRDVSCATIDREVCLKHLKSLVNGMDERQNGGEFYKLDLKYREALPQDQFEGLRNFVRSAGDVQLVMDAMRTMMEMLSSPMATYPTLKENLPDVEGDLEGCSWYAQHFPGEIRIECILETYRALRTMI